MSGQRQGEETKKKLQRRFRDLNEVRSTITPLYPSSCEREYLRVADAWLALYTGTLEQYMPELERAYAEAVRTDSRTDSVSDSLRAVLQKISDAVQAKAEKFGLTEKLEKLSKMIQTKSVREWSRICRTTLGVDVDQSHYGSSFFGSRISDWIAANESGMTGITNKAVADLEEVLSAALEKKKDLTELSALVQESTEKTERAARNACSDQVANLNAQMVQMLVKDSGSSKYIWSTKKDSRVRECHRALEGEICDYDYPPEMWYSTRAGTVYTGRRCNPGEDYGCRCVAIPVFEVDTISVPTTEE